MVELVTEPYPPRPTTKSNTATKPTHPAISAVKINTIAKGNSTGSASVSASPLSAVLPTFPLSSDEEQEAESGDEYIDERDKEGSGRPKKKVCLFVFVSFEWKWIGC